MDRQTNTRFRRFQATTPSITEAKAVLEMLYRKFGRIDGCDYLCSETAIEGPEYGPYIARVGLIPWPYPIKAQDCVDFDELLAKSKATEIV